MKWILFACLLGFPACRNGDDKVRPDEKVAGLRFHFEESMKAIDSTYKLDSFQLIRTDTLTQRDKYSSLQKDLADSLKIINLRKEALSEMYKANLKLAGLSKGISNSAYRIYKSDAEENKSNAEKYTEQSKLLTLQTQYLDSLLQNSDSVKAIGYKAVCLYQVRRKDQSVLIDTGYILMNLDRNIIRKEDFIKFDPARL